MRMIQMMVVLAILLPASAEAQDGATRDAMVEVILANTGHECGHVCTEDRREGAEDRSEYVVTEEDAVAFADAVLEAMTLFPNVPVEVYLATAYHESHMQRYAVGPGGECGMFQIAPRYAMPEETVIELGCEERGQCDREATGAVCDWLQDVENSVLSFAEMANARIRRYGSAWECAYNQGHRSMTRLSTGGWGCSTDGWQYRQTNERLESWFRRLVERAVEESDYAQN